MKGYISSFMVEASFLGRMVDETIQIQTEKYNVVE
jgi:hypothetical protein